MTKVEVREVNRDEYTVWDSLVRESPHGTVFHLSDWINTCAALSNKRPLLLGYFENGRLIGGCSLYITEKNRFLSLCNSKAPTTPYGGFLLQDGVSTKVRETESRNRSILFEILERIAKQNFEYVNIISAPAFRDIRPLIWNDWNSRVYYTYMLPLLGDISLNISKKARNTIRKGETNGIQIRKCYNPESFWNLNINTYKKQGREPPFSEVFLKGMLDMIVKENIGEMWIAETSTGEPVSAEVITWDNHMAHRWSAASNFAIRSTGATSLLLFEIFLDLQRRGFRKINLMAANTPHLSKFISSFNPELHPYYGVERDRFLSDAARSSRRILHRLNPKGSKQESASYKESI